MRYIYFNNTPKLKKLAFIRKGVGLWTPADEMLCSYGTIVGENQACSFEAIEKRTEK